MCCPPEIFATKATPLRDDVPAFVLDLIDRAAAAGVPGISDLVLEAFDDLVDGISAGAIAEAIEIGAAGPIFSRLDAWEAFTAKLLDVFDPEGKLSDVMAAAVSGSIDTAPVALDALDMEIVNDRAAAWLARHGAERVTLIDRNTRAGIVRLVQDAFAGPETVRQAARKIMRSKGFGLTSYQAEIFEGWVAGVLDPVENAGLTAKQIQRKIDTRHRQMLRQRAEMIAHTEAYDAGNAAQGELWREAVDQGQLDAEIYMLEWVTRVVNVCPRCEALDGTTAEISGGRFESRPVAAGKFAGEIIFIQRPTVHPWCYCTRRVIRRADALDIEPVALPRAA